jgi:hypothetical protein
MITEPNSFTRQVLGSSGPGGHLARRLLPLFIFMPLFLGSLRAECEQQGWISHETGVALMALAQFFVGVGMLFLVAHNLDRVDALKKVVKMSCVSKKVFDQGNWVPVEKYLLDHFNIEVSHGMTPEECEAWLREGEESKTDKKP